MVSAIIANLHLESYSDNLIMLPAKDMETLCIWHINNLGLENINSFLQHLKNQKHSIHFIVVTNSNNTLAIHGTASLKQETVVYKIPCV